MKVFDEILDIIKEKGISLAKVSIDSGVEYNRMAQWKGGKGNPKAEDERKLQVWLRNFKGISVNNSPINTTESQVESLIRQNEQLTLSHRELTQANKDLAHANRDLAANLLELTKMVSSNDRQEKILTDSTKRSEALELLAPLVKGSLGLENATDSKALSELDRRLSVIEKKKKVKDS